jgi:multicomponent Na+:H+ antiporter subunit D
MSVLILLPIAVPLVATGISVVLLERLTSQRLVAVTASVTTVVASVLLLVGVDDGGATTVVVGGWEAPIGISLVADRLSVILLVIAEVMLLGVLVFAIGRKGDERSMRFFHPVYHVLAAGVALSFLTGDLFTLFVGFEVMLMASYVLLTHRADARRVRAATTYVVVGLVASALFLVAIAFTYSATGTVNLADLAERADELPGTVRSMLALTTLVVFGIKAAVFPLFFWLPDSYPTAPAPVTAIFAGLLTKVGVYAILRTQTLLFADDGMSTLLLVVAGATMLVGVLGAIAQDDIKRILSFHIISQIGYMIMGIALFTPAGIAATVMYLVHHIAVKTTLFLVGGIIEDTEGTGSLRRIGGLARTRPILAVLFIPAALSLAGLPPFSGFVAKLALVEAGIAIESWAIVTVSLLVSLLTLVSMAKIWTGVFWGDPEGPPVLDERRPTPRLATAAAGALAVVSLVIAAGAGPLHEYSTKASAELLDPGAYHSVVFSEGRP